MSETPRRADEEILERLDAMERRLSRLETRLPAPRPAVAPASYSAAAPPPVKGDRPPLTPPVVSPAAKPADETLDAVRRRVEELFHEKAAVKPATPAAPEPALVKEATPHLTAPPPAPPSPPVSRAGMGATERFVGTKLLGAIGALILLVGVAFALKVAFDRGFITPAMRVALGTLTGLVMFAGAEVLLRRKLAIVASVVAGGGIGILTLTNWGAHVLYGFSSFPLAFSLGCGITALGYGWSVVRVQFSTLLLAIVSGYLTPVLISKSSDHPWGITLYLAALAVAAAAAGTRRQWRTPVLLAIAGTIVIFTAWMAGNRVFAMTYGAQRQVRLESTICGAGLTLTILADFGLRAARRRVLGVWESFGLTVLLLWTALILTSGYQETASHTTIGALYTILSAALAAACVKTAPVSRMFRATTLTFAILGATLALGCFFEGATLALAWAVWAAALALLEARLRAVIPLLGCMLNHALVAIWIGSLGVIHENVEFLWSERSTVFVAEALALWTTSRALRTVGGPHAWIGRFAMAGMQLFVALLLLASVPGSRVSIAWAAQALALALIARRVAPGNKVKGDASHLDFALLAYVVLGAASFRFLDRHELAVAADATPFVNLRAAFLALAAAALVVNSRVMGALGEAGPLLSHLTCLGGVGYAAVGLATECAFLQSRAYGSDPPILHGSVDMGTAPYSVLWNARFVFLAVATAVLAAGVLVGKRAPAVAGEGAVVRGLFQGFATVAAHLTLLLGLTLEAMGLADARVGAHPEASLELFRASQVQAAISLALGLYSALVLAAGFRRSRVHRIFGLTGLLATVVKVLLVDLAGVALEWRMLIFLGLGALMLLGAYLYARAVRRGD